MSCVNNRCCQVDWPCGSPKRVGYGTAMFISALALGVLIAYVAKGAAGKARISVGGAVAFTVIAIVTAAVGGFLLNSGISKTKVASESSEKMSSQWNRDRYSEGSGSTQPSWVSDKR